MKLSPCAAHAVISRVEMPRIDWGRGSASKTRPPSTYGIQVLIALEALCAFWLEVFI